MNSKFKKIIIFFISCAILTGIVFFIKQKHDNNIEKTYIDYVENTLIPKYGKSSLYLENGNNLDIEGEKLLDKNVEGILFYKIVDLNGDSNKDLLVLRSNIKHNLDYEGSISNKLIYDIYTIDNKKIKQIKIEKNNFYLLGDYLNDPKKSTTEYSLFTNKNKSQTYFCTNYLIISNFKKDFYFSLNIFKPNTNIFSSTYELNVDVNKRYMPQKPFRILSFDIDYDLIFKNKTDLKNKCISDTQKYGLDNLIENIFDDAENKSFTDISKLNNIDKIISIKIK